MLSARHQYGVKADNTFWCKQGVIRRSQLRDLDDEQMIADLAITILEGEAFAFSGSNLDEYYNSKSEKYRSINKALSAYGATKLKNDIVGTLSILRETIEAADNQPNALRKIIHPDAGGNPVKTGFYAVFNAFFQLCVKQRKSPSDLKSIMKALGGLHSKLHIAAGQTRSEPRQQNIDVAQGLI